MEDTALYTLLLGIQPPWRVTHVEVALAAERIDVWVEEAPGTLFPCAVGAQPAPVYDHPAEQVWRHLDTCQCQTYVHARLPRTSCPGDGVKQIHPPWAEARSQFTRGFERRLIDTLTECDVTGVNRLTGTSWDEAWGGGSWRGPSPAGSHGRSSGCPPDSGSTRRRSARGITTRRSCVTWTGGPSSTSSTTGPRRAWSATTGSSPRRNWPPSRRSPWTCGTRTYPRREPTCPTLPRSDCRSATLTRSRIL